MKEVLQRLTLRRLLSLVFASILLVLEFQCIPPKEIDEPPDIVDTIKLKEIRILTNSELSKLYSCKDCYNTDTALEISVEDADLLMRLARSEAGDKGVDAQLLVMCVVMNRLNDPQFPNSIYEIIYDDNQFSVVGTSSFIKADVNADTHMALARLEMNEDISQGALYFESSSNSNRSWHSLNREFLFEKYGQRFYK